MANSKIDFSTITSYIPEAVNELRDMIREAAFMHSDLIKLVTVIPDVNWDKKIGYYGKLGDIGMKASATACGINEVQANVTTSEKSLTPKAWDTRLALCAADINNTIAMKGLKAGIQKYNMLNTEYFDLFQTLLAEAIVEMYNRFIWFGDLDAAHTDDSPAGYITPAKTLDMINVNDGLFKRLYAIIAAAPAQRVTIAVNDITTYDTYAKQNLLANFTAADCLKATQDLKLTAPMALRQEILKGGYSIKCTQKYFDRLILNWKSFELESMKLTLENGAEAIKVDGLIVESVPEWDVLIEEWENNGAALRNPYRALLYKKENAAVFIPSMTTWMAFDAFYEKKDHKVYIDMEDKYDTNFFHDGMVMFAV